MSSDFIVILLLSYSYTLVHVMHSKVRQALEQVLSRHTATNRRTEKLSTPCRIKELNSNLWPLGGFIQITLTLTLFTVQHISQTEWLYTVYTSLQSCKLANQLHTQIIHNYNEN